MAENQKNISKEREKIEAMFNDIAPKYDFLNHFLSLSIDKRWRKKILKTLLPYKKENILDLSTGTGDVAILLASRCDSKITGADISEKMLEIAQQKINRKNLSEKISLFHADAENLPFNDNSFDVCTVSFGVRNFEHLEKGLSEIYRVLKKDGLLVILEFSTPKYKIVKKLYSLYSKVFLPIGGRLISKHKTAYTYLPESAREFPSGNAFLKKLEEQQFRNPDAKPLTFGIASLYTGRK